MVQKITKQHKQRNLFSGYLYIAGIVGLLLNWAACTKEAPEQSAIPVIVYDSISPLELTQFEEKVHIYINYQDGDGDLGTQNPDSVSIIVKDSRLQIADGYHLKPLSPPGTNLFIAGQLDIVLKNLFVLGNAPYEDVFFEVYITDRKGHKSNMLKTQTVRVKR